MKDRMEHIEAVVYIRYPLLSKYLANAKVEYDPNIEALCTNGVRIKYNKMFFNSSQNTDIDREFFLLHELAHIFLEHHLRYDPDRFKDMERAQAAMDYEANDFLKSCGVRLWDKALIDFRFTDMLWEEIYHKLDQPKFQNKVQPTHGDVEPHPDIEPKESEDPLDNTPKAKERQRKENRSKLLKQSKETRSVAISQAKKQGNMPASLRRVIDRYLESTFDYRTLLAEYMVKAAGLSDYTYAVPNVLYDNDDGIIFPSMESEEAGTVVFVGDTSASISKSELREICGESVRIMESVEPEELILLWCDTKVNNPQVYSSFDVVKPDPIGGGGTDFKPPFKWLEDNHKDPMALIYLTDGYCDSFPRTPDYPVVWLIKGDNKRFSPPFGEVILMNN